MDKGVERSREPRIPARGKVKGHPPENGHKYVVVAMQKRHLVHVPFQDHDNLHGKKSGQVMKNKKPDQISSAPTAVVFPLPLVCNIPCLSTRRASKEQKSG